MQSFGVYHSSTRQTLVHSLKGELSQVVGTGSAGNREIFSYKTGSEAVYTSEFAARHSLSPAHTSALATLYSLSPASTPYGAHSTSPLLRESCFATSMSPHNVPIRHQSLEQNVTTSWGDQKAAAACKESHSLAPQKHLRPEATAPNEIKPRIYFKSSHHDPYYGFTHYSPHPVTYLGEKYPTSQHLFQAIQVRASVYPCSYRLTIMQNSSRAMNQHWQNISGRVRQILKWRYPKVKGLQDLKEV